MVLMAWAYLPPASAQTHTTATTDSIQLGEVEVRAAREVVRADGRLIYPSELLKSTSPNAYSLLAGLTLPGISVNAALHTVEAQRNDATVEVRINDIHATRADLLALDVKTVRSVDFIDNPGLRYGKDVSYVINVVTQRPDSGYTLGADLTHTLTTRNVDDMVYGKLNIGRSQMALIYDVSYQDFGGTRYHEKTDYLLSSGHHRIVDREDASNRRHTIGHNLQLQYSLVDSARYTFQGTLSGQLRRQHHDRISRLTTDGAYTGDTRSAVHGRSVTPTLDLYYQGRISTHRWFSASLSSTYISTDNDNYDNAPTDYRYHVRGRTWSVRGEAHYEHRLSPLTLSVGLQGYYRHMANTYSGHVSATNVMAQRGLYAFGEAKGHWGPVTYMAGMGISHEYYRQDAHTYDFWLLRPKATLTYSWASPWQLRYGFELTQHVSQVAMISNTMIRQNGMEWKVGNPDIRPSRVIEHTLSATYTAPRLQASLIAMHRKDPSANLALYTRDEDDQFYYSQVNQRGIEMFYTLLHARYELISDKLTATAQGGINRFFNHGYHYDHALTTYSYMGSIEAHLGRWTLTANVDNGWNFMEGETKSYNAVSTYLTASYRWGPCEVSLYWQHPLQHHERMMRSELVDVLIHRQMTMHSRDLSNMLTLGFSWKLHRGRQHGEVRKGARTTDEQTGIML